MADSQIANNRQRILFITQDDPFYVRMFFEEFFKQYPYGNNVLGVVICPAMGKGSLKELARQMFNFYGTGDFLRMCWRYAGVKLKGDTLKMLCKRHNIPIFEEKNINGSDFISYWKERDLDVIVSVAAPRVFKERLIGLPRWGCINIHHAKLPYYRGMMPNFWQMYHLEKTAGITVHRVNQRIDEGEIILQKEIPIKKEYSLDNLIKHSKKIGAHCVIEVLGLIKENKVNFIANHKEKGSYFTFPNRADAIEFRRRGKSLL